MKGIYIIAIASLASWTVSAANVDRNQLAQSVSDQDVYTVCPFPEPSPKNTTTNLPHEYDCTLFYKCFLGKGVLQKCPLMTEGDPITRLHYNRLLQVCDWPWQAGCESCPQRYRNGPYPPPSKISYPSNNCNNYYQCTNGVPELRYCQPGTCFSRTCQDCVVNRDGGYCGGWRPPVTPTTPPVTCINGDRKPHECNCAKYYTCYDPDWIESECENPGLNFSPTAKVCLPPDEAGCLVP